jgi:hypothetical protein
MVKTPDEMLWAIRDDRTLSKNAKLAWVMLLSRGPDCRPSLRTVAEDCGVSRNTLKEALGELEDAGWLKRSASTTDLGDSDTYSYVIKTPGYEGVGQPLTYPPAERPSMQGGGSATDPPGGSVADRGGSATDPEDKPSLKTTSVKEKPVQSPASAGDDVPRPDVKRLCGRLADRIEANGSKRPTVTKAWLDATRLLLDRDKRTEAQVAKAIDWCQNNEFWRRNIMSMPTLRKQYDRLRLQAQDEQRAAAGRSAAPAGPGSDGWIQPVSPFRDMT